MRAMVPGLAERFQEPDGFVWGRFRASDGAGLRWGHMPASPSRAECVLVGGFKEFIEKYFETICDLNRLGLSVWCLDWRGQGGAERPRLRATRPGSRDFVRDAADLASFVRDTLPERRPRIVIGHSMGGAITLLCLHDWPKVFDLAVLSAPMLTITRHWIPERPFRLLLRTMVGIGLGSRFLPGSGHWRPGQSGASLGSRTSSDPDRSRLQDIWFTVRPNLRTDGVTFGWLASALSLTAGLQDDEFLREIKTPILIGSAGRERFVDPRAHQRAADLLPDCRLISFPDAKHELFLETDANRSQWLAAIRSFIQERAPGLEAAHLRD